jgi:hypothetical protein
MSKRPTSTMPPERAQGWRDSIQYLEFLQHKVESARASMHSGKGQSNDEIEAEFAVRRAQVSRSLNAL